MEEPPQAPYDQGLLTNIKNLATYVLDPAANFLGFTRDAEVSALVLGKELDRFHIQTEADHGRMGQDKDMYWEHGKVWGAINMAYELAHKK